MAGQAGLVRPTSSARPGKCPTSRVSPPTTSAKAASRKCLGGRNDNFGRYAAQLCSAGKWSDEQSSPPPISAKLAHEVKVVNETGSAACKVCSAGFYSI